MYGYFYGIPAPNLTISYRMRARFESRKILEVRALEEETETRDSDASVSLVVSGFSSVDHCNKINKTKLPSKNCGFPYKRDDT